MKVNRTGIAALDDRDIAAGGIRRHRRQPVELTCRPAIIDDDVAALDEAHVAQAAAASVFGRRHGVEDPITGWRAPMPGGGTPIGGCSCARAASGQKS